jgi:hypothetical protein
MKCTYYNNHKIIWIYSLNGREYITNTNTNKCPSVIQPKLVNQLKIVIWYVAHHVFFMYIQSTGLVY